MGNMRYEPAFPQTPESWNGRGTPSGMSLRAYFAAAAMQGSRSSGCVDPPEDIARRAIADADELLKQLNKPTPKPRRIAGSV